MSVIDKIVGRSDASADLPLANHIATNPPTTVREVIALMNHIDAVLPESDGLKWFNRLYNMVTQAVNTAVEAGRFMNGAHVAKLDVIFANRYFNAFVMNANGSGAPRAWRPLLQYRQRAGVSRLQYALAGMNAHINHDLALSVVDTCRAENIALASDTPFHKDFLAVNGILEETEAQSTPILLTGVLGTLERSMGHADNVLAMWSVRRARDSAWTNAEVLWSLRNNPTLYNSFTKTLDGMTGFAGRGLLLPGALEKMEHAQI